MDRLARLVTTRRRNRALPASVAVSSASHSPPIVVAYPHDRIEYGEDKELQSCINGKEGIKLLKKSIKKSAKLNVTKSCTILIEGKQTCIHDGEWKDCPGGHEPGDFADQVRSEWSRLNASDDEE